MEYKGHVERVEHDDEAGILRGEVITTRDVITFQGAAVAELKKPFRDSVEDYLAFCSERGEEPEKPFSGHFITRIRPQLHRRIGLAAALAGKSLNAWVTEQLGKGVQPAGTRTNGSRTRLRTRSRSRTTGKGHHPG
jgi:predicted HicB family RNase H-like nuclease